MGIILELQQLALDGRSSTLELLRKASFVARKLGIKDFQEWTEKELNGYKSKEDIPDYRIASGKLEAFDLYRGWTPVIIPERNVEEELCKIYFYQSVSSLISFVEGSDTNSLSSSFSGQQMVELGKMIGVETEFRLRFYTYMVSNILEKIKNIILDWALLLEESGISGDGLVFTENEKKIVKEIPQIINYVNNFYGDITKSQVQLGTTNSSQKIEG